MILFLTDLHLDNWRSFSTLDPMGNNTRLLDQLTVSHEIAKFIEINKPKAVFFLGDLFNGITEYLPKVIYKSAYEVVKSWAKNTQLYLVVGNHDIYKGTHILGTFESIPNTHIISTFTSVSEDGHDIDIYPWGSSSIKTKVKGEIACGHMAIKDAWVDASKSVRSEAGVPSADLTGYKYVILGHFHEYQEFPIPGTHFAGYIGAVMQMDLKASPSSRGIWVLDKEFKMVEIPSPKIYKVRVGTEDDLPSIQNEHYYKIIIPQDSHLDDKIPKSHRIIIELDDSTIQPPRLDDISVQEFDLREVVSNFIRSSSRNVDKEKAIEYVKEIL